MYFHISEILLISTNCGNLVTVYKLLHTICHVTILINHHLHNPIDGLLENYVRSYPETSQSHTSPHPFPLENSKKSHTVSIQLPKVFPHQIELVSSS